MKYQEILIENEVLYNEVLKMKEIISNFNQGKTVRSLMKVVKENNELIERKKETNELLTLEKQKMKNSLIIIAKKVKMNESGIYNNEEETRDQTHLKGQNTQIEENDIKMNKLIMSYEEKILTLNSRIKELEKGIENEEKFIPLLVSHEKMQLMLYILIKIIKAKGLTPINFYNDNLLHFCSLKSFLKF